MRLERDRHSARDTLFGVVMFSVAALVMLTLAWVLYDIVRQGVDMWSASYLLDEPANAGRSGGIAPILVATLAILAVALAVALPLGVATAVWLVEFSGVQAGRVRLALDALAGVPSIVFGLFGSAFFGVFLGLGFSILSGGLTLACMVLPLLIRTTEAGLAALPNDWRRGGAAARSRRAG